jgi:hypothetical protein
MLNDTNTDTMTSKTYTNDVYTRTVELVKSTAKCEEYGWKHTVKVTTLFFKSWNPRADKYETRTTVEKYWVGEDWLRFNDGHRYYSK